MVFPIKIPIRYHHFSYNNEKISNQFEILEKEYLGVYEGGGGGGLEKVQV